MKIIFIYSLDEVQSIWKPLRSWTSMHFGISYISSVLKSRGHQTRLMVLGSNNKWSNNIRLLKTGMAEFKPHLVCFTAVASQYPFIKKVAIWIKNNWPDKYLLIGGVHSTLNPSEVMNHPFDAVCIGEGEYPVLELCDYLGSKKIPHKIANLWIKAADGTIEKNSTRPFNQHIDDLPFPDHDMWHPWMKNQLGDELVVLLGRGCPYNCSYCCNHAIKDVSSGQYVRMRSAENIINEIAYLHRKYPSQHRMYFEVETIALNKAWLFDFCRKLGEFNSTINNSINFGCNFRISPQSIDENIFIALKKANFYRLNIGLESGSDHIRRRVLKRYYSNDDFLKVVNLARKYNLKISVYNMIGLPGETYDDYRETVKLNRLCQPDSHYTGIFYPYPGTELYATCIKEGLIKGPLASRVERRQAMIDLPNFSKQQILRAFILFNYRVYKGYKPLWWTLIQTLRVIIYSVPVLNFVFRKIVQLPILRQIRLKFAQK